MKVPPVAPIAPAWTFAICPAHIQKALNNHDCIKRLTEIPLFCGHKDKYSITTCLLVDSAKKADQIAAWVDDRRSHKFTFGGSPFKIVVKALMSGTMSGTNA
jgi:hypothetical protein